MTSLFRAVMVPALTAGLCYVLAFPDSSLFPAIFIFAVPLIIAVERAENLSRQFAIGAVFGCVFGLGLGWWLLYAMVDQYGVRAPIAALVMIAGVALPHALLFGMVTAGWGFFRKRGIAYHALAVPALWVLGDYCREFIGFLVPWGFPAYAVTPWNAYIQAADLGSVYGVTVLVLLVNAMIARLSAGITLTLFRTTPWAAMPETLLRALRADRTAAVILAAALVLPPLYGTVRRLTLDAAGPAIPARVVQGNFGHKDRWSAAGFPLQLKTYLGLSEKSREGFPPPRIIAWPETVLNHTGMVKPDLFAFISSTLGNDTLLIAGGVRATGTDRDVHNTAYLITHGEMACYDKNILLPYAETAPLGFAFRRYYDAPAEFVRGRTRPSVAAGDLTVGLSICFEALYPWHARAAVNGGAEILVNISNDSWFGPWGMPPLHLNAAVFRAVETRRWLIRAANSGISAIIAPDGTIRCRTRLMEREVIDGTVHRAAGRTAAVILGDWVVLAAAAFVLVQLVQMLFKK